MEKWRLQLGKKEYFIDGFQAEIIKMNMEAGKRFVIFEKITFTLAYIEVLEFIETKKRPTEEEIKLKEFLNSKQEYESPIDRPMTKEESDRRIKWFIETRNKLPFLKK